MDLNKLTLEIVYHRLKVLELSVSIQGYNGPKSDDDIAL